MPLDLIAFVPFALAMTGTPGPANVVVMSAGAAFGVRRILPLLIGVILGKQFVIWPVGFGLMALAATSPTAFEALKWLAMAYILRLAWRIARLRVTGGCAGEAPPGFLPGLIVHPLNPKAWAMVAAAFAGFVDPAASTLTATLSVALGFLAVQMFTQPLYALAGDRLAALVSGRPAERWIMSILAIAMVASMSYAVFLGG